MEKMMHCESCIAKQKLEVRWIHCTVEPLYCGHIGTRKNNVLKHKTFPFTNNIVWDQ